MQQRHFFDKDAASSRSRRHIVLSVAGEQSHRHQLQSAGPHQGGACALDRALEGVANGERSKTSGKGYDKVSVIRRSQERELQLLAKQQLQADEKIEVSIRLD
jgi:hypothetical protein